MSKKDGIISAFNKLKDALLKSETEKLNEIILDDYRGFSLHGTIETKDDIISSFKHGGIKLSEYSVEHAEYEQFYEIALVTGKGKIAGKYEDYEFHHTVLFTDVFKYSDGSWKYFRSQVTEIKPPDMSTNVH
ncbi:MAG: nuclear transport factor 2 family protein [Melioribacteraceae bacterium]|nr:nuclear transport factor 2 family protein [Melioribacteraceae bacterium]